MTPAQDRRDIAALIDEATAAGASFTAACNALGLSPRTLQRWRDPAGGIYEDLDEHRGHPTSTVRGRILAVGLFPVPYLQWVISAQGSIDTDSCRHTLIRKSLLIAGAEESTVATTCTHASLGPEGASTCNWSSRSETTTARCGRGSWPTSGASTRSRRSGWTP